MYPDHIFEKYPKKYRMRKLKLYWYFIKKLKKRKLCDRWLYTVQQQMSCFARSQTTINTRYLTKRRGRCSEAILSTLGRREGGQVHLMCTYTAEGCQGAETKNRPRKHDDALHPYHLIHLHTRRKNPDQK